MSAENPPAGDRISNWLLLTPLVAVTFLLKFAFSVGDGSQVFAATFIILGVAAFGFLSGRLETHKGRLAAFCALTGILSLTQLLGDNDFSVLSFLMLLAIHIPYVFQIKPAYQTPGIELTYYQKIMAILAVLGIIQYFGQFIVGPDWAFFMDTKLPANILPRNYNSMNAVSGSVYKTTGFFVQEPSNFSQLLAVAIIIQILFYKNLKRLVLYLFTTVLTFSGTGLIMLFILMPAYLIQKRQILLLLVGIGVVLSAPVWGPLIGLKSTVSRADEIFRPGTSGYARFITPNQIVYDNILTKDAATLAFGDGAGSMTRFIGSKPSDYGLALSTVGKMIYEYGVMGSTAYFAFFLYVMYSSGRSGYIVSALALLYLFMGEYILVPTVHGLILPLLIWPGRKFPEQAADEPASELQDDMR